MRAFSGSSDSEVKIAGRGDKLRDAATLGVSLLQGLKLNSMTKPLNKAGQRTRLIKDLNSAISEQRGGVGGSGVG